MTQIPPPKGSPPDTASADPDPFQARVFPAELAELRERRRCAGDERPIPAGETPTAGLGLSGLALSGGGIRSAAFGLGVLQSIIRRGALGRIDYLSTVSGGGFTGSCLSSLMHADESPETSGARLLVDTDGSQEPPALNAIRDGSNYLAPRGQRNGAQLPAMVLVGALQTILLAIPLVIGLVFLTEVLFEVTSSLRLDRYRSMLPLVGVLPLALATLMRPVMRTRLAPRASWDSRDRADRRLGSWLVLAVASLIAVPVLELLELIVDMDGKGITTTLVEGLRSQWELGLGGWLAWSLVGLVAVLGVGFWKFRSTLLLALAGAVGPLSVGALYVVLCGTAINSPLAPEGEFPGLVQALLKVPNEGSSDTNAWEASLTTAGLDDFLASKGIDLGQYSVEGLAWSLPDLTPPRGWLLQNVPGEAESALPHVTLGRSETAPDPWLGELRTGFEEGYTVRLTSADPARARVVIDELSLFSGHAEWWLYLMGLLLWMFNVVVIDVNQASQHPFYRDRLSRTFLLAPNGARVEHVDDLKLSELRGPRSGAPYHLVNTALNLQGSGDAQLRDRGTVPFVLSKLFSGSSKTGYCPTTALERLDPQLNLGTAMAVSAAAAAPNMGSMGLGRLTFLMTILNIRLGYWLPNPMRAEGSRKRRLRTQLRPGVSHIFREALRSIDDEGTFVNCTDGGHVENLGVYELLVRRCRTIVCVDAEADGDYRFSGLTTLQRYASIDLDAQVSIEVESIRPGPDGVAPRAWALGAVTYSDGSRATLVYLKLALPAEAPEYLRFYQGQSPSFPHESTSDQFFGETQFEVYRALGNLVADQALEDPDVQAALDIVQVDRKPTRRDLRASTRAPRA